MDDDDINGRPALQALEPGAGGDRGFGDLLLAAIAGSLLAPFVQAVATKAGEDVYAKIKDLLAQRGRDDGVTTTASTLSLADPERAIVITFPARLSRTQAAGLAAVRLPAASASEWILVQYDAMADAWHAIVVERQLPNSIELTRRAADKTDE